MLRAATIALLVSFPVLAIAPAEASTAHAAQEESRAENYRRGFNSGVLHPEEFAEIDRPEYTQAVLDHGKAACLADNPQTTLRACTWVGFITGRRVELAYRARIAESGEAYVPYLTGTLDTAEQRAQAIRAYRLRVYPDQEALSDAEARAAAFLIETQPCIDALGDAARAGNTVTDCPD